MITLLQDLRYSVRSLVQSPGYTIIVVLILALGVGANAAIFSLVSPFIFRALPYQDADRIVHMFDTYAPYGGMGWDMQRQALPTVRLWQQEAESFEQVGAYYYSDASIIRSGAEAERVTVGRVSWDLFDLLGVPPALGRPFSSTESSPGEGSVVLLSDDIWRGRFGGDPAVVGSTIRMDGREHVVVGVMPPQFNFPFGDVRMWAPITLDVTTLNHGDRRLLAVGRLRDGVDIQAATSELEAIQQRLATDFPEHFDGWGVRIVPLRNALIFFYTQFRAMMLLLMLAVIFVLLIVCANVGNLALSRSRARQREFAVRAALGAGRGRIVRQLVTESCVLATIAAVLGIGIANAGIGAVGAMVPDGLWRVGSVEIDRSAVAYTLGVSILAAIAFGLLPALKSSKLELMTAIKEGGARGTRGSQRLSRLLVAAQVAVATLLCGGALMTVSAFRELRTIDLGFESRGLITMQLQLPRQSYPSAQEVGLLYGTLVDRVESLPAVQTAAVIDSLPLGFSESLVEYAVAGQESVDDRETLFASSHTVSEAYFETMSIPVLQGRRFDTSDTTDSAAVVVVNQQLALKRWPSARAVGATLLLDDDEGAPLTVIGVVGDSAGGFVFNGIQDQVFFPQSQRPSRRNFLIARVEDDSGIETTAIRSELAALDRELPAADVRTMTAVVNDSEAPLLVASQVLAGFGVFALGLAAIGVYGVVAFAVSQRTREIGLRMALGAHAADVVRLVLRSGLVLASSGALVGGLLTYALGVAVAATAGFATGSALLPLAVVLILTAVALLAAWLPARRATRIDPVVALRVE